MEQLDISPNAIIIGLVAVIVLIFLILAPWLRSRGDSQGGQTPERDTEVASPGKASPPEETYARSQPGVAGDHAEPAPPLDLDGGMVKTESQGSEQVEPAMDDSLELDLDDERPLESGAAGMEGVEVGVSPAEISAGELELDSDSFGPIDTKSGLSESDPAGADQSAPREPGRAPDSRQFSSETPVRDAGGQSGEVDNALRLEVAKAYMDLGDDEGARVLLDLVESEGGNAERDAARKLRGAARTADGEPSEAAEEAENSMQIDSNANVESLLDLATAYIETGEFESARLLLDRVEVEGDDGQRRDAEALRARLS